MKKIFLILSMCVLMAFGADVYPQKLSIALADGRKVDFQIDIADTPEKAEKGLMFRSAMPDDAGMLFVTDKARVWTMWMKNTMIPLDMVFFDDANEVVYIKQNATPYSLDFISYPFPVKGVLELNGGTAKRLGIKSGDVLSW